MDKIFDKANELLERASKEKDIARKLDEKSEHYLTASLLFKEASVSISKLISNENDYNDFAGKILSNYYMYESVECEAGYEYYSHGDMDKTENLYKKSKKYLHDAINITEKNLNYLKNDRRIDYSKILYGWKSSLNSNEAQILGAKARKAWESSEFVLARDYYGEMVNIAKKNLEFLNESDNFEQVFKRIALGNYIAFKGNYINAFGAIIATKAKNNNGNISTSEFLDLLKLHLNLL